MNTCTRKTCAHTVIAAGLQKLLQPQHVRTPPPHPPNPSATSTAALSLKKKAPPKSPPHPKAEKGRGLTVTLDKHKALTTQWRHAWGELGRFDSSTCHCTPPPSCHLRSYTVRMRKPNQTKKNPTDWTISLDHSCYRNTQESSIFMSDTSFNWSFLSA